MYPSEILVGHTYLTKAGDKRLVESIEPAGALGHMFELVRYSGQRGRWHVKGVAMKDFCRICQEDITDAPTP